MKKYCLIGEHLSHSYSAEIHGLCGLHYELIEVKREDLKNFIAKDYDGFNITIPYKKDIIPLLDVVDDSAKAIGAVNTVVKSGGKYYGYNTDLDGMRYALKRKGISLRGKRVMILGTGGTALTAAALCKKQRAKSVVKVSRFGEVNYENYRYFNDTEVVINATPVGMFPNSGVSPIDLIFLPQVKFVFDCIYNPFKTALIMQAEKLGIPCSDGLPMLVKQALRAEEMWGETCGKDKVEEIVSALYFKKSNLVLCGMPSSGKTSLGKIVAGILGKTFIDTDAEIYNETGKTPAEIIEKDGETAFRDIESETIKRVSGYSGAVIATGGGAILRDSNVCALKANGVICYVKRDLSFLSVKNRPLSQINGIEKLFEERKSLYERAADFSVENNGALSVCARNIAHKFKEIKFNPKIKKQR